MKSIFELFIKQDIEFKFVLFLIGQTLSRWMQVTIQTDDRNSPAICFLMKILKVSKSDCDCESRSFFWENWENHNLLLRLSDLYLDIESGTFHEYQTSRMHVYLEVVYHLHIRICVLQYLAKVFKFLLQNSNSF